MRRNEITPELIELNKRAKELGFPQVMEKGDWYCVQVGDLRVLHLAINKTPYIEDFYDAWLILSFSRCLEWFVSRSKGEMIGLDLNNFIHGYWIMGIKTKTHRGKNIHECGAQSVVKMLEEEQCK